MGNGTEIAVYSVSNYINSLRGARVLSSKDSNE